LVVSHRPDVGLVDGRDATELVILGAGIGTLHDAPLGAVPVLDQRLAWRTRIQLIGAHGPHILWATGGHTRQQVDNAAHTGTGHHTPLTAIPVLGERLAFPGRIAHRPDVAGR